MPFHELKAPLNEWFFLFETEKEKEKGKDRNIVYMIQGASMLLPSLVPINNSTLPPLPPPLSNQAGLNQPAPSHPQTK